MTTDKSHTISPGVYVMRSDLVEGPMNHVFCDVTSYDVKTYSCVIDPLSRTVLLNGNGTIVTVISTVAIIPCACDPHRDVFTVFIAIVRGAVHTFYWYSGHGAWTDRFVKVE